ncbi:MAG: repeat-containing protein [Planctomycetaceae bacterium]|nr:repeat-containing protein [Planctomycetaceae bacterium]
MLNFTWNNWVLGLIKSGVARKARRVRIAQIEGLEERVVLTANLPVAVNDSYFVTANTTLNENTSVLANDTDADGDTISQAILQNNVTHGTLNLNSNGTFRYTPTAGFTGTDSFTYFAKDAANNETSSAAATVTLNVAGNSAPVVNPVTLSTSLNTAISGTLTGTDANGDTLIFAAGSTAATHGTVTINPNGSFTFTPTSGFTGAATFSYKANDGNLDSNDATVTINVGSANVAPVVNAVTLSTNLNTAVSGTLTGTDSNGDTLTFSAGSTAATHGTVTINSNGSFTFTPTTGFTGAATFSYKANDGSLNSNNATVTINVGSANVAPVVNSVTLSTNLNTAVSGTLTGTDANSDALTFSAGSIAATHGTVTINPNGSFTFTPTTGFTGAATFSYKANDGSLNSNDATVTINVGSANVAPVVNAVTLSTNSNTAVSGTLTGTDANGDALTFSAGSTAATHGTVTINPNGSFTFTPTTGFTGAATFSYKANDGSLNSNDATVTINVGSVNVAPAATPQTVTTTVGTAVSGTLTGTDANGDTLTFSAGSSAATHGTVVINPDGSFTFTPTAGFTGVGTFSFKASDGILSSPDALVSVNINASGNTAPTVSNGTATTSVNTALNGSLASLATDAQGDTLTFAAVTQPANGTVTVNPNGTFVFTPNAGFVGTTSFTFTASDGSLTSTAAMYTVTVTNSNQGQFGLDLAATVTVNSNPSSPTPLDPNATLTGVGAGTSFANAQITASFVSGVDSKSDRLVVVKNGSSNHGSVQVHGKKILVDGTQVATVTSGNKKGASLQINFTSNATEANVDAVLQRIAIQTRPSATSGVRKVQIQVSAAGTTASDTIDATVSTSSSHGHGHNGHQV